MANPILNERTWNQAARNPGWGAPDPTTRAQPLTDGPISSWHPQVMTVGGTISAAQPILRLQNLVVYREAGEQVVQADYVLASAQGGYICSLCLATDKTGEHVLPAQK